jgi:hypothetical protein
MKRAGIPFPPPRFTRKLILPPDFIPTTPKQDAERFGVDVNIIKAAMRRQGIPPHQRPEPKVKVMKYRPPTSWAWAMENLTSAERAFHWRLVQFGWAWVAPREE